MSGLSGGRCKCGGCGQRFNSVSAFDFHRAGVHGLDRHCRQPSAMRAIGMRVNDLGFWIERHRNEGPQNSRPRAPKTRSRQTLTHGAAHG